MGKKLLLTFAFALCVALCLLPSPAHASGGAVVVLFDNSRGQRLPVRWEIVHDATQEVVSRWVIDEPTDPRIRSVYLSRGVYTVNVYGQPGDYCNGHGQRLSVRSRELHVYNNCTFW